jgi:LmbE family N-acetylglucosaminyl deacetylase
MNPAAVTGPSNSEIFIPFGQPQDLALARTTHLGIVAHQDDLEFLAFHGILHCFRSKDEWFGGIVCTDGSGSAHTGPYAHVSSSELAKIRMQEQRLAAEIGRYSFVAQLGYPSKSIARPVGGPLVEELTTILRKVRPKVLYTHNPADKHETHIRVLVAVLEALRAVPATHRPSRLLGCEGWRDLDWISDDSKVVLDVGGAGALAASLNGVFDSQIAGGKRYDLAVVGRRRAHATFLNSHAGDEMQEATFAMDLTPLIGADSADLVDFTLQYVERLSQDIRGKLEQTLGRAG